MAISVNRVTLVGRLGGDPEAKGRGDNEFAICSVATSRSWKDRDGGRQEKTEWHKVVVFNRQAAGFLLKYGKKGDLIHVEGSIETEEYEDRDGNTRKGTQIVVRPFDGGVQLQSKGDRDSGSSSERGSSSRGSSSERGGSGSGGYDTDDEIPF